ncbi:hypothetical protein [Paenibacillus sp. NPDC057967]|uniref:hypothetical protein n=1 Tax=Paenibacillus sp. NPDC057967 TaxID=3346293 RepID=UPI0036DB045B
MIAGRVINIMIGVCLMLSALTQIISKYPDITPIYIFNVVIFMVALVIVGFHFVKLRKEKRLEVKG